jgi:erythronate-4-phosphate dehydrogenase
MKILGDSQILRFDELFSSLGETATYSGRELSAEQLEGVDVLITRSTLKVDADLLANSQVKFVGTCTIGIDHFDTQYLDQQGITWTNAAGCNANSVAQYVLSAMAQLAPNWLQSTVGIIGCGNIGGRVYQCLTALGVHCRVYDPFLSAQDNPDLASLEHVLQSDIVTSHAPLTREGAHPTYHLLNAERLAQLRAGTLLVSAGRGAVIDNQALLHQLSADKNIRVALDVWDNEPDILTDLIPLVDIATPHIAGYSIEGKENGTVMVYQQLCEFLQIDSPVDVQAMMTVDKVALDVALSGGVSSPSSVFNQLLLSAYPIMLDDQRLRSWDSSGTSMALHFDSLRKQYPIRREYPHFDFPACAQQSPIREWLNVLMKS